MAERSCAVTGFLGGTHLYYRVVKERPIIMMLMEGRKEMTVLLVEDDLNDIFLVKRAFKKANIPHPLQVATDGVEALQYLIGEGRFTNRRLHPLPHLIIMDLKMPRKTGLEVLEWIKKDGFLRRIPVIIVSSSDHPSDINQAYALGANAYMVKPVDLQVLQELLSRVYLERYEERERVKGSAQ